MPKKSKAGRTRQKTIKAQPRRTLSKKKTRRRILNPCDVFFDQEGRLVIVNEELAGWLREKLEGDRLDILSIPIPIGGPVPKGPMLQCPDVVCDCKPRVRWRTVNPADLRKLEPLQRPG